MAMDLLRRLEIKARMKIRIQAIRDRLPMQSLHNAQPTATTGSEKKDLRSNSEFRFNSGFCKTCTDAWTNQPKEPGWKRRSSPLLLSCKPATNEPSSQPLSKPLVPALSTHHPAQMNCRYFLMQAITSFVVSRTEVAFCLLTVQCYVGKK